MFDIEIISTGSKGNAMLIDNHILIDCGLSFKNLKEHLSKVHKIFITHRHSDHLNLSVLRQIKKHFPHLLKSIYINQDTYKYIINKDSESFLDVNFNILRNQDDFNIKIKGRNYNVRTFNLYHDVENYGFIFTKENGETLLYSTDTSSMIDAPNELFDYILLEGNYDEDTLTEQLLSENVNDGYRAVRNLRHLSVQQFEEFIFSHSHKDTIAYQLHESGEFGRKTCFVDIENR